METKTRGADRRGRVADISQYLDPGCMTKAQYYEFVKRNGHAPNWPPKHERPRRRGES